MHRLPTLGATALAAAILLSASAGAAVAAPPKDLDAYVNRAVSTFGAPGMAVAIVEDGKTTWAKGYGVRKLGEAAPVDAHTIFPIGSNTKAFTATALAILVDEGKLSWDDKVVSKLPGFQMYDPYVTGEMTVRDLLVHRSGLGLGEGDLMVFPETNFTRQEIVEHLRYLKPATSFRSGFAYDNVLYIAAGQLVEAVSGETWEAFVAHHIFVPVGMTDSKASFKDIGPGDNRGWPHARLDGPMRGMGTIAPFKTVPGLDAGAPAGAINASAVDMAKWLEVQLDHGAIPGGGKRLFSEAQHEALWNPETLIAVGPPHGPFAAEQPQFQAYALGFFIRDYKGHKIVTHSGAVLGGISVEAMIPDRHIAFMVMTNSEEGGALQSVFYKLLDHYLDQPQTDWVTVAQKAREAQFAQATSMLKAQPAAEAEGPGPSLPVGKYAGVYRDPWYGPVTVSQAAQGLQISFDRSPGMVGKLEHVRYDTFRTRFSDRGIEDAYVTFQLKSDGSIDRVKMKPVSPLADFSFDYQDLEFTPDKAQ
jgi:CubicO group peptidase (beta-lactamase class C family)